MRFNSKQASLGLEAVAIPVVAVVSGLNNGQNLSIESAYLEEKRYSKCDNRCIDIEAGYIWAKELNICDAFYESDNSPDYDLGVKARAWDACAYSDENGPV